MANYETRFEAEVAESRRAVVSESNEIRSLIPNFSAIDFDRLIKAITSFLSLIDKGNIDHPEYLAHSSGNIAEYSISLISGTKSSLEIGASNFVETILPGLLSCEERLSKAVGNYHYKVKRVKERYVRELEKLESESLHYRESSRKYMTEIENIKSGVVSSLEQLNDDRNNANKILHDLTLIKSAIENIASDDGRGKSLEALKRKAIAKLEDIESVLEKASRAYDAAQKALVTVTDSKSHISIIENDLQNTSKEANAVLSLSNQAGLAASYLKQEGRLSLRSHIFTGILYCTSLIAVLIAAFYVLPSLENAIADGGIALDARSVSVTLLRATVLAPIVFVIFFTAKQISAVEILRMDYAEKAAASLAYSGYKNEMSADDSLLERLRSSLLLRFAEHPERLLRKTRPSETLNITGKGFRASSRSHDDIGDINRDQVDNHNNDD